KSSRAQWASVNRPAKKPTTISSRARMCKSRLGIACPARSVRGRLPQRNLELQLDVKLLEHPAADEVDEPEHVAGGGALLADDEVGVAVADLGGADVHADQAGLFDEGAGAEAARIREDARRRLKAVRLARLALDPRLAHAFDDGGGGVLFELE